MTIKNINNRDLKLISWRNNCKNIFITSLSHFHFGLIILFLLVPLLSPYTLASSICMILFSLFYSLDY